MSDTKQLVLFCDADLQSAPERFKLIPWGLVRTSKGDFTVDDQAAADTIAAFKDKGVDMVFDLEHQSEGPPYNTRSDGAAPAQGWIKKLEAVHGEGIFACVDWTDEGRARLASRTYRYHSPVLHVGKKDGRLVWIKSCALTNTPAMDHCDPLVNKDTSATSEDRDVTDSGASDIPKKGVFAMNKKLLELLALSEDASEEQALEAVKALKDEKDKATGKLTKVCTSLEVDANASADDIDTKIVALKSPIDKVDVSKVAEMETKLETTQAELKVLKADADRRGAEEAVKQALKDGKILNVQCESMLELALSDRGKFDKIIAAAPVIRPPGKTDPPADDGAGTGADRKTIIAKAGREYADNEALHALTSRKAFVCDALREAGKDELSDEEIKVL